MKKTIQLAALWFQIRSLEIFLDGQAKALELVADSVVRADMKITRANAMLELTRLKAEYRRLKVGSGIAALRGAA